MKKILIGIIIGILVSTTGVLAANYLYKANEIEYEPQDEEWNVDNVESAISDLYDSIGDNKIINNLIPTLSANNSNIVHNFDEWGGFYKVFDNNDSTYNQGYPGATTIGSYLGYTFDKEQYLSFVRVSVQTAGAPTPYLYKIQTYDGENWIDVDVQLQSKASVNPDMLIVNRKCYGVRMYFTGGPETLHVYGSYAIEIASLQAYGY